MSDNKIHLVLTDKWFEEIKSGRKTHEYRQATSYYWKRLKALGLGTQIDGNRYEVYRGSVAPKLIEFQKGYRKNAERMLFEIKQIDWLENGKLTDWVTDEPVFDIHLGVRYE